MNFRSLVLQYRREEEGVLRMVVKEDPGYSSAHCAAVDYFRLQQIKRLRERLTPEETLTGMSE